MPVSDRQSKLNNLKDKKIERVIDILGVKRSNVHFIENYHSDHDKNSVEIDYQALLTLNELVNLSERFIEYYLKKSVTCFNRCF